MYSTLDRQVGNRFFFFPQVQRKEGGAPYELEGGSDQGVSELQVLRTQQEHLAMEGPDAAVLRLLPARRLPHSDRLCLPRAEGTARSRQIRRTGSHVSKRGHPGCRRHSEYICKLCRNGERERRYHDG